MGSSKQISALLLICMVSISSVSPILACGTCPPGKVKPPRKPKTPIVNPPVVVPPITVPPVVGPPLIPPVLPLPPVVGPIIPPVLPVPPVVGPIIPPVLPVPPVVGPPVVTPPATKPGCAPPPAPAKCPINALKLGGCVDLLGGLVNIKFGDPAVHKCCPVLGGLMEMEAAVCLCTTLKAKFLNLDIFFPIALKVLAVCGKTPPPGYDCKA